jgi:UDP-3-O-[3-hydroxymyristoyl] N-acetylglucosamine deacetylase
VQIGTVEHLLSAIMACGITDVDIHIDGPEVPIIDGSALPFMHLIDAAGVRELGAEIPVLRLREPIELVDGDKSIRIAPASRLIIKYKIDFNHPVIGRESFHFDFGHDNFLRKIAPARTFGFMRDVEKLRAAGLARGGSVENAVVLDDRGVVNGPLRFKDEFVRHKILDLVGDLALIGRPIVGEITAHKAGHAMHSRFVEKILQAAVSQHESRDSRQVFEPASPSAADANCVLTAHPCGKKATRARFSSLALVSFILAATLAAEPNPHDRKPDRDRRERQGLGALLARRTPSPTANDRGAAERAADELHLHRRDLSRSPELVRRRHRRARASKSSARSTPSRASTCSTIAATATSCAPRRSPTWPRSNGA